MKIFTVTMIFGKPGLLWLFCCISCVFLYCFKVVPKACQYLLDVIMVRRHPICFSQSLCMKTVKLGISLFALCHTQMSAQVIKIPGRPGPVSADSQQYIWPNHLATAAELVWAQANRPTHRGSTSFNQPTLLRCSSSNSNTRKAVLLAVTDVCTYRPVAGTWSVV